ncbi:MAG: transcriptional regulator [Cyclobacteriaceae bacterium]|nr:transcriptional regulator [Cyclobacteriaceae bacterium]
MVNDFLDFNALKNLLDATDGNLASHLKSLEKEDYIT